jgi:putative transport protein
MGAGAVKHFLELRPLVLLFGVSALGYLVGQFRLLGFSLGVAAVLFAGLFIGWAVPGIDLPDFIPQLGLVLFVYTVGLASGPGFFASLRLRGLRDNGLALAVLLGGVGASLVVGRVLHLSGPLTAGLFAGSFTNTPALAAVVESLKAGGAATATLAAPVLSCTVSYPIGVLLPLVAVALADRFFAISYRGEPLPRTYGTLSGAPILNVTARVEREPGTSAHQLRRTRDYTVVFSRLRRGAVTSIVHDDTLFQVGDLVTIIGARDDVLAAAGALGEISAEHLEIDRSAITYRRIFVSNPEITERPMESLGLTEKYDAVITRVRRGDVDLAPHEGFELMLGDRARVVAPNHRIPEIEKLLGDSARRLAEVDIITFGLGITLGLLLGAIAVPLPGGARFTLGLAGGPLVAGLILGRLGRTRSLVWSVPYGANMTLRQLGVVLFLAGVGIRAGGTLSGALAQISPLRIALGATAVTAVSVSAAMLIGRRLLRIPLSVLAGTVAGILTQPAVLALAVERSDSDLPNVGYAAVFPVAMIAKILLAQLILRWAG